MTVHELKIAPKWFEAVVRDDKRFEVRKSDRSYNVGDFLQLNEWDDEREEFTGRRTVATIIYILTSEDFPQGIRDGYSIIGFKHLWYYAQMGAPAEEVPE